MLSLLGRVELRAFLVVYLFTLPLQLVTTGSFIEQGSTALVVFTAIHAGAVAALFWTLLGNAIIATQVVEDGTPSSLIVRYILYPYHFWLTTTWFSPFTSSQCSSWLPPPISLLTLLSPSQARLNREPQGTPFILSPSLSSYPYGLARTSYPYPCHCPLADVKPYHSAALLYFILMTWVVVAVLREMRPLIFYALAALLFIISQLAFFLLSRPICNGSNAKVDGSFIATLLETASVFVIYLAWRSITEGNVPLSPMLYTSFVDAYPLRLLDRGCIFSELRVYCRTVLLLDVLHYVPLSVMILCFLLNDRGGMCHLDANLIYEC